MRRLFSFPNQIVTVDTGGTNFLRGKSMNKISPLYDFSVLTEDGIIKDFIPNSSAETIICDIKHDLSNKIILPGLIDCHTHSVFAGQRSREFGQKLAGVHYNKIAESGGGINTTVKAVKSLNEDELALLAQKRIDYFIEQGITSLEIKSGYGLDFGNEIKILNVIKKLSTVFNIDIIPTFLGAHTYPNEFRDYHKSYIDLLVNQVIPFIAGNNLALFCDAFCENEAFSAQETDTIFECAASNGLPVKLHTNQFTEIGGIDVGLKYKAVSLDHLETADNEAVKKISASNSTAVLLPGVSFFLNYDYAPARDLIDNDAIVALATDYNPGSCNIANISMIMGIAALKMKMSPEEIISAFTINAAKALLINDKTGSIEIGKQADFSIYDAEDYNALVYNMGSNLNTMTVKRGNIIYRREE